MKANRKYQYSPVGFVDDDPELVAAAVRLDYAGRELCRDGAVSEVPSITSLTELPHCF